MPHHSQGAGCLAYMFCRFKNYDSIANIRKRFSIVIRELTSILGRLFVNGNSSVSKEVGDDEASLFADACWIKRRQLQLGQEAQHPPVQASPVQLHESHKVTLRWSWQQTKAAVQRVLFSAKASVRWNNSLTRCRYIASLRHFSTNWREVICTRTTT